MSGDEAGGVLHATPWGRPPARFASTIARTQRTPVTYMEPKTAPTETAVATENPAATHIGTAAEAKASATAI
jgi:hypothetical protein